MQSIFTDPISVSYMAGMLPPYQSSNPYAVGPLHPSQVTEHACVLPNGLEYTLLVPSGLASNVLTDPNFWEYCEFGYVAYDEVEQSPMQLTNWLYRALDREFALVLVEEAYPYHPYSFMVAYLVGWLSAVAESDKTLALVGMAHLLFLLSYLPATGTVRDLYRGISLAEHGHKQALGAYRAHLRAWRAQAVDTSAAYQLAFAVPLC